MPKIYIVRSDGFKPSHFSAAETADMYGDDFLEEYGINISAEEEARLMDMRETQERYCNLLRSINPSI